MAECMLTYPPKITAASKTLGVKISLTTGGDPASKVEYIEGLEGMNAVTWSATSNGVVNSADETLAKIRDVCYWRTCHIAAGGTSVYKYLNPDDWRYYADGTSATNNMNSNNYNTMTEFEHFYFSVTNDGNYLYLRVSATKVDDTYVDWPFSYNGTVRASRFIGSFLAYNASSKLYSRANVAPTVSVTMANFRTYARAQGTGYDMWDISSLTILQILYLLAFKNTNSQSAVCPGLTGGSALANTGYNYNSAYGEFYRSDATSTTSRFRIFGIEDVWGNLYQYCSNIYTDSNKILYITDYNTADKSGNTLKTTTFSNNYGGYIQNVIGDSYFIFVAKEGYVSGSDSKDFCDSGYVYAGCVAGSGGYWGSGAAAGVFRLHVSNDGSADSAGGSRLVFVSPNAYAA